MARDPRAVVRAWGVVLVARIPWIQSMRVRAMAVVVAVVLAPLLMVAGSGIEERRVGVRLAKDVSEGAREAAENPADVEAIARRRELRIRVLDPTGETTRDVDYEAGTNPLASIGALFFGDDGAPSPRVFDDSLGPILARPESMPAARGRGAVCRSSDGAKLFACSAMYPTGGADAPRLVYAQASSRRAVRALYNLPYEISKLVLFLLPVGILLAWWLGWRTVRPIENLRAQVLARAAHGRSDGPIDLPRRDEIGDLALAFNGLLHTLDERRQANEAFVADLVHEFKNPVAAIRASAEQLCAGDADPRTRRLARVLEASSERLDALVTQCSRRKRRPRSTSEDSHRVHAKRLDVSPRRRTAFMARAHALHCSSTRSKETSYEPDRPPLEPRLRPTPPAEEDGRARRLQLVIAALLLSLVFAVVWGVAVGIRVPSLMMANVWKVPLVLFLSSAFALPAGLLAWKLSQAKCRATDLLLGFATGVFTGTLVLAVLGPIVSLYYESSAWAGPLLAQIAIALALVSGMIVFVRAVMSRLPTHRGSVVFPIAVFKAIQIATLLQLIALVSPILPEHTHLDHGIDGLASQTGGR